MLEDDISSLGAETNLEKDLDSIAGDIGDAIDEYKDPIEAQEELEDAMAVTLASEKFTYTELQPMVISSFSCHEDFLNIITPMEFEEMVELFVKYDVNKNIRLDKFEARKLLYDIKLEANIIASVEFIRTIAAFGKPDICFDEYCRFVVMIKNEVESVYPYRGFLDLIKKTPLGFLEHQTDIRGLKIKFFLLEEKIPPKIVRVIVEVILSFNSPIILCDLSSFEVSNRRQLLLHR